MRSLGCPCRLGLSRRWGLSQGGDLEILVGNRSCNDPEQRACKARSASASSVSAWPCRDGACRRRPSGLCPCCRRRSAPPGRARPSFATTRRPVPMGTWGCWLRDPAVAGRLHRHPAPVPRRACGARRRAWQAHHPGKADGAHTGRVRHHHRGGWNAHKVYLIVGHTHAFEAAVRLMRDIIARGALGKLGLIHSFNYTNHLYRPRRPEELSTPPKGGGILFNQVPHQIDTARLLGRRRGCGACAQPPLFSTRHVRPKASCAALLQFDNGVAASLVYSGYDHFDSHEWHFGINERGAPKATRPRRRPPLAWPGGLQMNCAPRTETFAYGAAVRRSAGAPAAFRHHHRHLRRRRHARLG